MRNVMKVPNNWCAVQFSTKNNYQTSSWHVFPPNSSQSMCGRASTSGTAKNQGESKVSRRVDASTREELADKLDSKLGAVCGSCGGQL